MGEMSCSRVNIPVDLTGKVLQESCCSEICLQIGPDSRLYSLQNGGALGDEQLRMLQVRLSELRMERPFKHLAITSAVRGEGKTHVAANLALTIATEGKRSVLLVDTDVRNPSLHVTLGVPNSHGFKDLLVRGGNPWKAIQKIKRKELYVMTGGTAILESLGSSGIASLRALMDQIGSFFDLVVFDAPPVLGTVDTKLLSTVADAILFVVRSGSTPRQLISQAHESLKGTNILGAVLNRIDPNEACFTPYYRHTGSEKKQRE